jgi:hypothetical protein
MIRKNRTNDNRSVLIDHDAHRNIIITGDGNSVVIYENRQDAFVEIKKIPKTDSTIPGLNPYKGLSAFQGTDAEWFFGREQVTERLFEMLRELRETHGATRIVTVLGPSGCGKSSVARAGLIPEIARTGFPATDLVRVAVFTPGNHPLEALAFTLARMKSVAEAICKKVHTRKAHIRGRYRYFRKPPDVSASFVKKEDKDECIKYLSSRIDGNYGGLRQIADMLPNIESEPLVLLVDQFEEVFTSAEDIDPGNFKQSKAAKNAAEEERRAFVGNLITAAKEPGGRVSVVLTLRSDFLGQAARYTELSGLISRQNEIVPAMGRAELEAAIAKPAKKAGRPLDQAMIDLLICETLRRDDALPLLEFALQHLWQEMKERHEPAEVLREIGGVGGALAKEAESLFELLDEPRKNIARRIFLRLVRLGEGMADTRRRVTVGELVDHRDNPAMVWDVLIKFSTKERRLITLSNVEDWVRRAAWQTDDDCNPKENGTESGKSAGNEKNCGIHAENQMAEITHEALFEHWERLKKWIHQKSEFIIFEKKLNIQVGSWVQNDKPNSLLWVNRKQFEELSFFMENNPSGLTPSQFDFFEASKKTKSREKKSALIIFLFISLFVFNSIMQTKFPKTDNKIKYHVARIIPQKYKPSFLRRDLVKETNDILTKLGLYKTVLSSDSIAKEGLDGDFIKKDLERMERISWRLKQSIETKNEGEKIVFLFSRIYLGYPWNNANLSSNVLFFQDIDLSHELIKSLSNELVQLIFEKIYINNAAYYVKKLGQNNLHIYKNKEFENNLEFKKIMAKKGIHSSLVKNASEELYDSTLELGKNYIIPSIHVKTEIFRLILKSWPIE